MCAEHFDFARQVTPAHRRPHAAVALLDALVQVTDLAEQASVALDAGCARGDKPLARPVHHQPGGCYSLVTGTKRMLD
jgi:hypothetical protein